MFHTILGSFGILVGALYSLGGFSIDLLMAVLNKLNKHACKQVAWCPSAMSIESTEKNTRPAILKLKCSIKQAYKLSEIRITQIAAYIICTNLGRHGLKGALIHY